MFVKILSFEHQSEVISKEGDNSSIPEYTHSIHECETVHYGYTVEDNIEYLLVSLSPKDADRNSINSKGSFRFKTGVTRNNPAGDLKREFERENFVYIMNEEGQTIEKL